MARFLNLASVSLKMRPKSSVHVDDLPPSSLHPSLLYILASMSTSSAKPRKNKQRPSQRRAYIIVMSSIAHPSCHSPTKLPRKTRSSTKTVDLPSDLSDMVDSTVRIPSAFPRRSTDEPKQPESTDDGDAECAVSLSFCLHG